MSQSMIPTTAAITGVPNEVLGRIFDFVNDGRDLSRCYAVCRTWRHFLLFEEADAEDRWERLCEHYGIDTELTVTNEKKYNRYHRKRQQYQASSPQLTAVPANLVYKDIYIAARKRLCRLCRTVKTRNLHYDLEYTDPVTGYSFPLCYECRIVTYPIAILTWTRIKDMFKPIFQDSSELTECPNVESMEIRNASTIGHMFRFVDVVKYAKTKVAVGVDAGTSNSQKRKRQRMLTVQDIEKIHQDCKSEMLDVSDPKVLAEEFLFLY